MFLHIIVARTRMFLTISFMETLLCFHNFGGSKLVIGCAAFQVKEVAPAARRRNARLSFAFVYPDKHGHFVVREVCFSLSLSTYIHIFIYIERELMLISYMSFTYFQKKAISPQMRAYTNG